MKKFRTTKKDFKLFVETCEEWLERLGLHDWGVKFEHKKLDLNWIARCSTNYKARRVWLELAIEYEADEKESIVEAAIHEVLELLLSRMNAIGADRDFSKTEAEAETHAVIHRLSKVFNEGDW